MNGLRRNLSSIGVPKAGIQITFNLKHSTFNQIESLPIFHTPCWWHYHWVSGAEPL